MSIKYNGKTIAGNYKTQIISNATQETSGIIKIATDEQVNLGTDNSVAVTPLYLSKKADKDDVLTKQEASETYSTLADLETINQSITDIESDLSYKQDKGNYVSYESNSVNVVGTTKNVNKLSTESIYVSNGIVMGGTALEAGLVTSGICGISPPSTTGACTKENLFINYDGNTTFNTSRQIVLQADTVGTHYGNNLYQYAVPRGEIIKNYVDSNYATKTQLASKQDTILDTETVSVDETGLNALGVLEKNTGNAVFDWIGTLEEWELGRTNGIIPDTYICFITND